MSSSGAVEAATNEHPEQPSNRELKEMLVELQISIAEIQRANNQFTTEVEGLRNTIEAQKREMAAMKSSLEKLLNQNQTLEEELYAARKKAEEQEQEIVELYDLQDNLEQYTRKNSLEIHGIPEQTYKSTEEVILKLSEALEVPITSDDIEISHKLYGHRQKPIIVKFTSHKVKTSLYKKRAGLKNVKVSDLFPNMSAAARVQSNRIFINENLTSYRRELVKKANQKRREGMLLSVWTLDGKIFVKTSPEGRPIRIYEENDLVSL